MRDSVAARPSTNLTVTVTLSHTFDADLILDLLAPDGTLIVLSENRGGGRNSGAVGTIVFDDAAPNPISSAQPSFVGQPGLIGTFSPETPLGAVTGSDASEAAKNFC